MITVALSVLALIIVLGFGAVVGLATFVVQRKLGSKWLWVVWLAPAVLYTIFRLTHVDYTVYALLSRPVLWFALSNFGLVGFFSGMVVWHTAVRFGPRPAVSDANGRPAGLLEDARGLTGILWRYEELLATYARALDAADPNPYPSVPQAVLVAFRAGLPSSVRRATARVRQRGKVPSILALDLTGAEAVLAELETLTPAQLSAIEACHRLNVRRLRQRSIMGWGWRSKLAGMIGAIVVLVSAAEYVGVLKFKDLDLWSLISGITMSGMDAPSIIARGVIGGVVFTVLLFVMNGGHFLPILQRLRVFEDILAIAKAYHTGQQASSEESERLWP